jgi:hypothetical protein
MTPIDPLADLRDIHLPPAVGWWPPAPGWWLLAVLLLATAAALILLLRHHHRRRAYRRAALRELKALQRTETDAMQFAAAVNTLLKRTALTAFPQREVAALHGADWLAFLDSRLRRPQFTEPALRPLAGCYRPQPEAPDSAQLAHAAELWIRLHRC